ncbi:cyclic nucleotide-binding domain protein (macronuclear) [Tetrahymena thermophila SB210]|uniref:Cyclic nucleotide-binding domain protein n=1 Tax=Tetrahymena thermophila (strain SB210) TaxID=312017 RepID=I7MD64_TETTS|nr:cyclic nucleotide-binding domain protein [Tetrahymena thermophila SB210]EAR85572.2 cyclic nucleotide-binding domain protein [Tetrahymena thermophila SB210]|eukprot:XP_001033235.2 cyclic nucleotide-binding domain protein [Tetrahymena thermophila SB210]
MSNYTLIFSLQYTRKKTDYFYFYFTKGKNKNIVAFRLTQSEEIKMLEAIKLLKGQSSFSVKSQVVGQLDSPKNQTNKVVANNKFSARNIFVNARLKIRVAKLLSALATRRFNNFTPYLFQKINDKAFYNTHTNKVQELIKIQVEDEYQSNLLHKQLLANRRNSKLSKDKHFCSYLIQRIQFILENIPIINPNSLPKLLWDSLLSFVIVVMLTVVPVKLAVQDYFLSYYLGTELVLILIIILTIIDIIINLNTAFFRNGKIVVKRSQIVVNYLNQVGIYDFLIMQALVYELGQSYSNNAVISLSQDLKKNWFYQAQQILLLLLFYVKSQKLNKFFYKVEEMLSFKRRTTNFLSLVKLLFFILKVGHIFACLWLFVGREDKDNSWLKNLSDDWKEQYIKSFYFIAVTMTTIGYGDIVPTNLTETIISIFSMIIAAGVFGYTINSIGTIFLQLKKEDEQIQENLFTINRYMSEKNITRELQQSIREYLEYYWSQWKDDNSQEEQKIIQQLSEEMKMSLLMQANKIILNDCQFLQKNFTQEALQNCVKLIKEKKLTPNEFLINSMEDNSKNGILFFVERGEIDIYQEFSLTQISTLNQSDQPFTNPLQNISNYLNISQNLQGQMSQQQQQVKMQNEQSNLIINETSHSESNKAKMHVCTIKKGQYFGENSFFTNFNNRFIAKSRGFSKVLYIERDQFIEYLKANHFNDDYEKFCHLRDSIIQNDLQNLHQKCSICKNLEHNPLQCSYVHHQPLKLIVLKRYNCSKDIKIREKYNRRKVKQKNCLSHLDEIYEQFEKFIQKNENYIEENIKLVDYTISDLSDDFDESEQSSSNQESQSTIQQEQNNLSNQLSQFQQLQNENNKVEEDLHSFQEVEADDNTSLFKHTTQTKKLKQQENKFRCNQALPNKFKQSQRANYLRSRTDLRALTMKVVENQSDSSHSSEKESQKQVEQKSHENIISQKKIELKISSNGISKIVNQNSGKNIIPSISSFKRIMFQDEQPKSYVKQLSQKNIDKQPQQSANTQHQRQSLNPFNRMKSIKAGIIQRTAQRQSNFLESLHFQNQIQYETNNENKKSSNLLEKKQKEENISLKKQRRVQIFTTQDYAAQDYTNFHLFQSDFAFVSSFEVMKNYKFYYPKFNSDKIISKLRRKRIQGNNILKLTLQAKSKINQVRRESIFQIFQTQLNVIKNKRLSDKFRTQEPSSIQLNEKNNQQIQQYEQSAKVQQIQEEPKDTFTDHITEKKLIDKAEPLKVEQKSNNSSSKNFFKNIKLNLSKKPLSPQQTMLINIKKNSISDENNLNLDDEDFNFDKSLTGSGYNRLKLSRTPSNFTKLNFIKNDSQQIDDNQTDIYQSNL